MLNFLYGIIGLSGFLYMWVSFDKKALYQKIFQSDGIIYARNVFNSATWNTITDGQMTQNTLTATNEILLLLKEDQIRDEIKVRTKHQNKTLTMKRHVSYFLSGIVLCIGWGLIYLGTVYEDEINDISQKYLNNAFIGEWAGTIIMTVVNYLIPFILSIIG